MGGAVRSGTTRRVGGGSVLQVLVVPLLIDSNAKYFVYSRMALIAIVVMSVTILTGWAGQLSLASETAGQLSLPGETEG